MELESQNPVISNSQPQNMLLLQASFNQSRIIPVYSFDDALQKMIKIYGEAMALKNANNHEVKDIVRFSLKSMSQYYQSMLNIMYMQKDNQLSQKNKQKHKTQLQSFDKAFILANLKSYTIKKSTEKSIEFAKTMFKSGQSVEQTLKRMGFNL